MNEIGFKLSNSQLTNILDSCLKPEEIAGDATTQLLRVQELLHWFARLTTGSANSKWTQSHAMELAYYIATMASNRYIDIEEIRKQAFKEGASITKDERGMLNRLGWDIPEE